MTDSERPARTSRLTTEQARRIFKKEVGPRRVGGVYTTDRTHHGAYTVLAIHYGPQALEALGWDRGWAISVLGDEGQARTHCTAWGWPGDQELPELCPCFHPRAEHHGPHCPHCNCRHLENTGNAWPTICPQCRSIDTEEYGEPIPNTDDSADCARCRACRHSWALDPGADRSCSKCGGSGDIDGNGHRASQCPCTPSQQDRRATRLSP